MYIGRAAAQEPFFFFFLSSYDLQDMPSSFVQSIFYMP